MNGAYGRRGNIVSVDPGPFEKRYTHPFSGADWMSYPLWSIYCGAHGIETPEDSELKLKPSIEILHGVYDLFMLGAEAIDIENRWQLLAGGPAISKKNRVGVLVGSIPGEFCEVQAFTPAAGFEEKPRGYLLKRGNFSPAEKLPEDAMLVVRTSAIAEFEAELREHSSPKEKPLSTTERTSLLTIIAALAAAKGIDISKPSKAALSIESLTDQIKAPVAKRTIEEHLKRIPDALERRTKS
ncbi:hypothetical protein [Nitrosospira sp. Nsp2]|uniref:hypothetical protein n=1 Tax=Nitrosospira sp. Nsp2 TaxID=136548 RepID=UPI0011B267AE|nr:hypothetical protein [Nitrosospira sp. Nsp2]